MQVVLDHQRVVLDLELLQARRALGRLLDARPLDPNLPGRLPLLRRLPHHKRPGRYLPGQNLRPHVVLLLQTQPHLLQDVRNLLHLGHRPERLHRHLLQNVRRLPDIPLLLLHRCQLPRDPRPLNLHIYLPLRDTLQRPNHFLLRLPPHLIQELHALPHHGPHHLLELPPALCQQHELLLRILVVLLLVQKLHQRATRQLGTHWILGQPPPLLDRQQTLRRLCKTARFGRRDEPLHLLFHRLLVDVLRCLLRRRDGHVLARIHGLGDSHPRACRCEFVVEVVARSNR